MFTCTDRLVQEKELKAEQAYLERAAAAEELRERKQKEAATAAAKKAGLATADVYDSVRLKHSLTRRSDA